MDMQGKPIGSSDQGMKNTTDPSTTQNPVNEGPGGIASDSLAADSLRSGGDFAANNSSAEPMGVSGSSSTLANEDTSGATKLDPTPDAPARDGDDDNTGAPRGAAGEKYAEGAGGQGKFEGRHNLDGYSGGPTSKASSGSTNTTSTGDDNTTSSSGAGNTSSSSANTGNPDSSSNAGTAPSYITPQTDPSYSSQKPKGKNLTEGGFDSDDTKNTSFTTDIDDKDDPGAAGQLKFAKQGSAAAGAPASGGTGQDGSMYGGLNSDETA